MDFGIAKLATAGEGETQAGIILGTPAYMPPERLLGGTVSGADDVWALAVTAYETLAGKQPFQGEDWQTVAYQICNQPAPDPRQFNAALPEPMAATFERALSKKMEDRYPRCASLVDALVSALEPPAPLVVKDTEQGAATPPVSIPRSTFKIPALAGAGLGILIAALIYVLGGTEGNTGSKAKDPPIKPDDFKIVIPKSVEGPAGAMVLADGFYIDKTEVSNAAYAKFCEETNRPKPAGLAKADPQLPVVNVSHQDAEAFAAWAGKRLPTAAEWEKAARGKEGWLLPWGNNMEPERANLGGTGSPAGPAKVESFERGASPYGALHMVGNVWEWTSEPARAPDNDQFERFARMFRELRPPLSRDEAFFQVRGGSFRFAPRPEEAGRLCSDFSPMPARVRRADIGFRCAKNIL
jgi:formylglycine-generating enzyme required for sulfatase activity